MNTSLGIYKKQIVWVLVAIGIGAAAFLIWKPGSKQTAPNAGRSGTVPVAVAEVAKRSVAVELRTVGTVHADGSVAIRSRIDGEIAGVHFREGEDVKQGQLLFTIDERGPKASLAQAEAQLARDQVTQANARREVERYAGLTERGIATKQKLDDLTNQAKIADAAVKMTEAMLANSRLQVAYTRITAPIGGRAGAINLPQGNMARAAEVTPLVTINRIRPIDVSFNVPQRELPAIRSEQAQGPLTATVSIPGDRGESISGKLDFIDNAVDTTTGTILLKAVFENTDGRLWPGQLVDIALRLREDPEALVVPAPAVQIGQNGSYVYVVKSDQTAEVRQVTVARTKDAVSVIASGLEAGETVVVDGQLRLAPGIKVEARNPGGAQQADRPVADAPRGKSGS